MKPKPLRPSHLAVLDDSQLDCLRTKTQGLATYLQRIYQRYQRDVSTIDGERSRRAARARRA
jgi:hypothetical protein